MASPFHVFRRHQRVLLASLGLMAMISFVFLPQCGTRGGGEREARDTVVVNTTRYGSLRESQIQRLQRDRMLVLNFLRHGKEVAARSMQPKNQMDYFRMQMLMQMPGFLGEATESNVANTWLLAQRAAEIGIVVSDDAIVNFVKQQTMDRLGDRQVREVLQQLNASEAQLIEALRRELAALQVMQMFETSLLATTPDQRYDYFCRLNRQAAVELAAISVDKFLGQVPDPSEQVVQEFFAKHKEQLQQPGAPEPGFREPYRATIEYLRAEIDKFVDAKAVTDAEIEQYYNENKENYRQPELPTLDEKKPAEPEKKAPEGEKKAAEPAQKAPEAPKAPVEPAKAEPKKVESKKEEPKKEEAKKVEPAKSEPAKKPEKKKAAPAAEKKTSGQRSPSPFRLVSYAEDKPVKPADAKPADVKPSAEQKPATPPAKPAEAKPVAAKPAETKPADTKPAAASAPTLEMPALKAPATPPAPKYMPLDKVKDEIRTQVARRNASKKMQAVLEPLRNELKQNAVKAARSAKGDALAAEFAKFDTKALAQRAKLELAKWELISAREAEASELGQSTVTGNQPFMQYAFVTPGLGRVAIAEDLHGNKYLFWKIDEKLEHVPDLKDPGIRDKVVLAWKRLQARELATKEAQRLAEQARAAKKPLKEVLKGVAGVTVVEPRPFSWVTMGAVPVYTSQVPPRLSDVEGVSTPGMEFMRAVFALKPGEVGVATNHPQTTAFVVRLDSFSPAENILWERFTTEDFARYRDVAAMDQMVMFEAWRKDLRVQAGFHWERPADRGRARYDNEPQGRQPMPGENELD